MNPILVDVHVILIAVLTAVPLINTLTPHAHHVTVIQSDLSAHVISQGTVFVNLEWAESSATNVLKDITI